MDNTIIIHKDEQHEATNKDERYIKNGEHWYFRSNDNNLIGPFDCLRKAELSYALY